MYETFVCDNCTATILSRDKIYHAINNRTKKKDDDTLEFIDVAFYKKLGLRSCCAQTIITRIDNTEQNYGMKVV